MCCHAGSWAGVPGALRPSKACLFPASLSGFPGIAALQGSLALPDPPALARQVNTTLDYDSEAMAAVGFQFTATIMVTAGGQSPRSSECPCLQRDLQGMEKGPS